MLLEAFHAIVNRNAGSYTFEELYRNAYSIVLNKHADKLHANFTGFVRDHLKSVNRDVLDKQFHAISDASSLGAAEIDLSDARSSFLRTVHGAWQFHLTCMGMMSDVLRYMDKVAFKEPKLPLVYDVGLALWRDHVLRDPEFSTGPHLTKTVLELIESERRGALVDQQLLKDVLDILQLLSSHGGAEVAETAYSTDFEVFFLQESREFYMAEASKLICERSASDYLSAVEQRLREEEERVAFYLAPETSSRVKSVVDHEMIAAHMDTVIAMDSGLASMLVNDRYTDLAKMFRVFLRVDSEATRFNEALAAQVVLVGSQINSAVSEDSAADKGAEKVTATALALRWVEEVLELRSKYDKLLQEAFGLDTTIRNTITKAFSNFVNRNHRSAEFISLFIDENLKKGLKGKTEQEVDTILEQTVSLFRYVNDKDVFERYYKNHLAKRLLNERSVSNDAERGMIAKLKVEVGSTFTSKMEGMFKDMRLSEDILKAFKNFEETRNTASTVEFSAAILTSTFWPISTGDSNASTCLFPDSIEQRKTSFQQFYLGRHNGRTLRWLPSHGTADIRTHIGKKRYDLNVSTYAMAVLLRFNDIGMGETLSFNDLLSLTSIQEGELVRTMQSLACAKYKILAKNPKSRDVKPTDLFSINESFTSPQMRIKIATIANKVESENERKETLEKIEESRTHQTEACIVRTMKARKTMDFNNLIAEVTKQLSPKFSPDPTMIKRRIDALIDREYLERDENDRRLYKYLA